MSGLQADMHTPAWQPPGQEAHGGAAGKALSTRQAPRAKVELSEEELAALVTRDAMIGVATVTATAHSGVAAG